MLKNIVFIAFNSLVCAGSVQAIISMEKVYNTVDFPFKLSSHGFHCDMKEHLTDLLEDIDNKSYSHNVAKLFIYNRTDLIHKVSLLMFSFRGLEYVDGFEETAKDLQLLVRNVWVLDNTHKAKSALGSKDDFKTNISNLYSGLDQFLSRNIGSQDEDLRQPIKYAKTVLRGLEDAILIQHLQIMPALFQKD